MPLYEFVCTDCDREFELLVRGNEKPACEECGGQKLTKLLSVASAHSAGSHRGRPESCDMPSGMCGMGGCGMPECGM